MKQSQQDICIQHNQPIVVYDKNISYQKQQGLCLICVQMMFQDDNIIQVDQSNAQQKEMINATIVECQNHIGIMNNLTAQLNEFKNNVNMNIDKFIEFLSDRSVYIKKQLQILQQPNIKFNPGILEKQKYNYDKYIGNIRLQLDCQLQGLINITKVKHLKITIQRMRDNIQNNDLNESQDEENSDINLEKQELQIQIEQTQQQIRETQQQIACTKKEQIEIQQQNNNQDQEQQTQQQIQNSEGKQSHTLQQIQKTTEAILRTKQAMEEI